MYSCFVVGLGVGEATVVSSHCGNQPKEVHAPQVSSCVIQDFFCYLIICYLLPYFRLDHDQGKQVYFRENFASHKVTGNFLTCPKLDLNSSSAGT